MNRQNQWLLALAAALLVLLMPGCKKSQSDVQIAEVWGKGSYIGPGVHGDSKLEFRVKVKNLSEVGASIKEFLLEIRAGSVVVIQASKTGNAAFQDQIVPDTHGWYGVAAGAEFVFSLLYFDHTQDIYGGKNPDAIKATLTIEDDNGHAYTLEATGLFEFLRY
jgi:hypothetical protein